MLSSTTTTQEYEIIELSKEIEKNCFLNINNSEIKIWVNELKLIKLLIFFIRITKMEIEKNLFL